jgi:hypothetical protein
MTNKYEVATGLWIGSEIGDLNREIKTLMKQLLNGDDNALDKIKQIARQRQNLLSAKNNC